MDGSMDAGTPRWMRRYFHPKGFAGISGEDLLGSVFFGQVGYSPESRNLT